MSVLADPPSGSELLLSGTSGSGQTGAIATTVAAGDADGDFVALYEACYPRLVRSLELAGATRSRAEDVAQEAFARTLGHWRRVRSGTNPAGYVYRTAFRLVRRRSREPGLDASAHGDGPMGRVASPPDGDLASLAVLQISLSEALDNMPPARRRCAVLCLVAELSPKEAGQALGIAESTVRKQLERARTDLRAVLGS
jgi:RNA polymerase sigma factor (sigma-70 family)